MCACVRARTQTHSGSLLTGCRYTALINAATLEATRVALDTAHVSGRGSGSFVLRVFEWVKGEPGLYSPPQELGATSLVRVRYQANTTMDSMSGAFTQVLCYGTAVKCTPRVDAKTPSTLVEMPPVDAKMVHSRTFLFCISRIVATTCHSASLWKWFLQVHVCLYVCLLNV